MVFSVTIKRTNSVIPPILARAAEIPKGPISVTAILIAAKAVPQTLDRNTKIEIL